jgi:hypothetical protein
MQAVRYTFVLLTLSFTGCQSNLEKIGQEHAREVIKWQKLAEYAGNELKPLGLTITAGVQINQNAEAIAYSIIKVQLNRDANHTEVDLLSPEFAEKFACGKDCQKLGLYDSNFTKPETQLSSFFFEEEGRFFEFYGRLTRLNDNIADYRASSPEILKKYLNLMLNRKLIFNSLSEFIDNLEKHITEEKLLAFSKSGFISPVEDRLSSTFLDDVIANLPVDWKVHDNDPKTPEDDWQINDLKMPDHDWQVNDLKMPDHDWQVNDLKMPDHDWQVNDLKMPDQDWQVNDLKMPDHDWQVNDLKMPDHDWDSNALTTDELIYGKLLAKSATASDINESWEQAKQNTIQVGSIACSFSDNSFGVVTGLEVNQVTLKVIAQARVLVDGMKLYPQPGYLFTSVESFYFVKSSPSKTYPLSDIATCNIEYLKRSQS